MSGKSAVTARLLVNEKGTTDEVVPYANEWRSGGVLSNRQTSWGLSDRARLLDNADVARV